MKSTPRQTSPAFSNLIGIPYAKKNCWEVARDFYLQVLGIELKHYYSDAPQDRSDVKNLIYSSLGEFEKVDEPKFGDLILIKLHGIESHIAIYLHNGQIFHSLKNVGSTIDRYEKWSKVVVGIYRPVGVAA